MCGILTVAKLENKLDSKLHKKVMKFFTIELLLKSQSRGEDGTGLAMCFGNGQVFGIKRSEKATDFARYDKEDHNLKTLLKVWGKYTPSLIMGHCRKASVGSKEVINTQPFLIGNILGVHNGTLRNHEKIKDKLKIETEGDVDSELIFHILNNSFDKELTFDLAEETVNKLRGAFAVLAVDINYPYKILGFRDARPIVIGVDKGLGLLVIVSEKKFITETEELYNRLKYLHKLKWPKANFEITELKDDTAFLLDLLKNTLETKEMPKTSSRDPEFSDSTHYSSGHTGHACGYGYGCGYGYNSSSTKRTVKWDERTRSYKKEDTKRVGFPPNVGSNLIADREEENRVYPLMDVKVIDVMRDKKNKNLLNDKNNKSESNNKEEISITPISLDKAIEEFKKSGNVSAMEIKAFEAGWIACLSLFTKPKLRKIRVKKAALEKHLSTLKIAVTVAGEMLLAVPRNMRGYCDKIKTDKKIDVESLEKIIKNEEIIKLFKGV